MLRPRDEADVAEILADSAGALEPRAGGSKRDIGRAAPAQPLELAALSGILDYEPHELVLSARAATPLREVRALLREHGQCLAFEPPDWSELLGTPAEATLGGVLASNASGPRRLASGAARDHFLGFRAVSGAGERFRGGGRVVKNVTGYDLPKLLAGSWGTLAVLTEVTVRVHPAPETERTLLLALREPQAALRALGEALRSAAGVSGAAFDPQQGALLRLEGFAPSVQARAEQLLELLRPHEHAWLEDARSRERWAQIGSVRALADCAIVWRLCVPPADAERVLQLLAPQRYLIDWGGALLWLGAERCEPERVRGALRGGHALLVKAPHPVRERTAVFQPLPEPLAALVARLKAAFDPQGRLSPERMR